MQAGCETNEKWNPSWYFYTDFPCTILKSLPSDQLIISLTRSTLQAIFYYLRSNGIGNNYNFLQLQLLRLEKFQNVRSFPERKYPIFPYFYA